MADNEFVSLSVTEDRLASDKDGAVKKQLPGSAEQRPFRAEKQEKWWPDTRSVSPAQML